MTNKELEEAFMENIKYGQRYLKRMHDANPDKEEGAKLTHNSRRLRVTITGGRK